VPLGRHEETQATVWRDPISWFRRAHLISNPSAFLVGSPGWAKSTLMLRMMPGLSGQGVHPLVYHQPDAAGPGRRLRRLQH
jgi:hypothetical protein